MSGEVIKSFLVGLGFGVDDASLAKFNKSIATATVSVTALYAATETAAAAIVYGISEISEGFEKMGYEYRIIAPAINKALILRRELLRAYAAAGLNITKVVQASVRLNMSLAKTRFAFKAIYDSVGSKFFGLIMKQSDALRDSLYRNLPQIQNILEHLVNFIFNAVGAFTQLGERLWEIVKPVYEYLVKLDEQTGHWSTIIFAVIAAWKLLNLEFLATPLGLLLTVGAALLALYDDYRTFKEGGNSLFNWAPAIPVIEAVKGLVLSLTSVLENLFEVVFAIGDAFWKLLHLDFAGFWTALKLGAESVWEVFKKLGDSILNVLTLGGALGKFGYNVFGGNPSNAAANVSAAVTPASNPLSSSQNSSLTNQNVNQQTSIYVTGSADASATGRSVADQQGKVNFDMVRNMKPVSR